MEEVCGRDTLRVAGGAPRFPGKTRERDRLVIWPDSFPGYPGSSIRLHQALTRLCQALPSSSVIHLIIETKRKAIAVSYIVQPNVAPPHTTPYTTVPQSSPIALLVRKPFQLSSPQLRRLVAETKIPVCLTLGKISNFLGPSQTLPLLARIDSSVSQPLFYRGRYHQFYQAFNTVTSCTKSPRPELHPSSRRCYKINIRFRTSNERVNTDK
ncbi:hypothetical protein BZA77DRAFT_43330 [Pyronema omphalodes]|nr:hypothetical protein BZA77DRAFT_43330 [Pyronema omphalodes]